MIIDADVISYLAGSLLSLGNFYIPKWKDKFASFSPQSKALVTLLSLAIVSGVLFGVSCAGFGTDLGVTIPCDQSGATGLITAFFKAAMANQATFVVMKPIAKKG